MGSVLLDGTAPPTAVSARCSSALLIVNFIGAVSWCWNVLAFR
jgi:hypothetical protein